MSKSPTESTGEGERTRTEQVLNDAIVIDGLGGSLVDPTPLPVDGVPYSQYLLDSGWTALNVTMVSHPTYTPDLTQLLRAIYENVCWLRENEDRALLIRTVEDIRRAKSTRRLGLIFGLQSPSAIDRDRTLVTILHQLGVRIMQLTYMERNLLGDGCLEPNQQGLTHFGFQVIREMNNVGILVDLSHVGERTSLDAIEASTQPVVFSHSSVRHLCPNPRNLSDEQIKAVGAKGGVIGLLPYAPFCEIKPGERPDLNVYLDHIDYVINLIGINHAGIGTDMFDAKTPRMWQTWRLYPEAIGSYTFDTRRVLGFSKKHELRNVVAGLLDRGYSDSDVQKILGGNFLRVFEQVWR